MDYDELVQRLRAVQVDHNAWRWGWAAEASDAIVALQARVAELEAEVSARSDLMQGYLDCWRNDKARAERAESDLAAARAERASSSRSPPRCHPGSAASRCTG
jgi:hypothetical protein